MGSAPSDMDKNELFNQLLFKAIPIGVVAAIVAVLIHKFVM